MGFFDKFKKTKDEEKKVTTELERKEMPQEFEYNPSENKVNFAIVQKPAADGASSFMLVMQIYDADEKNVFDTKSVPLNEILLKNIVPLDASKPMNINDETIIRISRFCKNLSKSINEAVTEINDDELRNYSISKYFSALSSLEKSNYANKFKIANTEDGINFESKIKNPELEPDAILDPEYYEKIDNEELLYCKLNGESIKITKSLKRDFNGQEFASISKYDKKNTDYVETLKSEVYPPSQQNNNLNKTTPNREINIENKDII